MKFKNLVFISLLVTTISLTNCSQDEGPKNSDPEIDDQSFTIDENSENGTIVGQVVATDDDTNQSLSFSIISGNEGGAFALSNSGSLTVADQSEIDYESNTSFNLLIEVMDDFKNAGSGEAIITVNLNDLEITTNGLVAFYPFNGNANDESANSNDGTVSGASLTDDREGNSNSAYSFDGVDDYIDLGGSDVFALGDYTDFSVSIWFKASTSSVSSSNVMFSKYISASDNRFYAFSIRPTNLISFTILEDGASSNIERLEVSEEIEEWHLATWTYSNQSAEVFVDGISQGTLTFTFPIASKATTADAILGATHSSGSGSLYDLNFAGYLDDFRIYDRVLSNEEIMTIYHEED